MAGIEEAEVLLVGGQAVCIGEGLVVLHGHDGDSLATSTLLSRSVGGAECNVASGLVSLGVRTSWVSRLGDDPFGRYVLADLAGRGVDVTAVELDPRRPTGIYLKDTHQGRSRMYYYRSGSAATAIDRGFFERSEVADALTTCELVHVSGITVGIVADPDALVSELVARRARSGFRLSVDLNWRPVMWERADPAPLVRLLREADIVFLGADEAQAALGTSDVGALRELIGPRATIVLKSDEHAATTVPPDGPSTSVVALQVEVREPIGAGDGFAAGYLAAALSGSPTTQCLRLGHLNAASVLAVVGDHAEPPPAEVREALLGCSEDQWRATVVGPDGLSSPALPRLAGTQR
jgi:2-dehydro-3-deoxygluconokinase